MALLSDLVLPAAIITIMFGMGLALRLEDFTELAKAPLAVGAPLLGLTVGLPFLAFLAAGLTQSTGAIAAGVLLIGASPAGTFSVIMSSAAGGRLALSVVYTALTSLLSVVVMPSAIAIFGPRLGLPDHVVHLSIASTVLRVVVVVVGPVGLGALFGYLIGDRRHDLHRRIRRYGGAAIVCIFVVLLAQQAPTLLAGLRSSIAPVLLFNLMALAFGLTAGLATFEPRPFRTSVLMAFVVRQEETGIFIALTVFAAPAMALPLLLNSTVGILLASVCTALISRSGNAANKELGFQRIGR